VGKKSRQKKNRIEKTGADLPSKRSQQNNRKLMAGRPLDFRLRRRWIWVFRFAGLVIVPGLFLLLFELILRISGYGYATSYSIQDTENKDYYRENDRYVWQFYSPETQLKPHPFRIPVVKPEDAVRIFVLGESAALGTPEPAYGFSRVLKKMLQAQFPEKQFELVNSAIRGINSHIILPIAKEIIGLSPDLVVIYMGNNEMVGLHAPGPESYGLTAYPRWIRVRQWLRSTKSGQFLWSQLKSAAGHPDLDRQQDMEFFRRHRVAYDDPRRRFVYENFERNLRAILSIFLDHDVPVLLSTIAVNLRDCPPLGSLHRTDMTENRKTEWKAFYDHGTDLQVNGSHSEAIPQFQKAAAIDDHYAELHYLLASGLESIEEFQKASLHYQLARDRDALPFRADEPINRRIRDLADEFGDSGLRFVDAERRFAKHSAVEQGVPGNRFFYEHVHLTFQGDYLLASSFLPGITKLLESLIGLPKGDAIPGLEPCKEWLGYTSVNEAKMRSAMIDAFSQPPFLDQFEHSKKLIAARNQLRARFGDMDAKDIRKEIGMFEKAVASSPEDWELLYSFGIFHHSLKQYEEAVKQFRKAFEQMPHYIPGRMVLAKTLADKGESQEAIAELIAILKYDPDNPAALKGIQALTGTK
jgi:tetratricopeptide (TPR) repeat protein